jgi:hypothetical protein
MKQNYYERFNQTCDCQITEIVPKCYRRDALVCDMFYFLFWWLGFSPVAAGDLRTISQKQGCKRSLYFQHAINLDGV